MSLHLPASPTKTLPLSLHLPTSASGSSGRYEPIDGGARKSSRRLSIFVAALVGLGCLAATVLTSGRVAASSSSAADEASVYMNGDSASSSSSSSATAEDRPIVMTHSAYRDEHGNWGVSTATVAHPVAATATFTDALQHVSNFGELHVRARAHSSSSSYTPSERAFAAGVLEGFLTHRRIRQTAENLRCEMACDGSVPASVQGYLEEQDAWAADMVDKHAATDPFWRQIGLVRAQFAGLLEGANQAAELEEAEAEAEARATGQPFPQLAPRTTLWDLQLINSLGDLFDVSASRSYHGWPFRITSLALVH